MLVPLYIKPNITLTSTATEKQKEWECITWLQVSAREWMASENMLADPV